MSIHLKNFLLHSSLRKIITIIVLFLSLSLAIFPGIACAATKDITQFLPQTQAQLETLVVIAGLGIAFISLIVVKAELKKC